MYVYEVTIANASNAFLQRYRLLIVLVEHNGPINSFAFNYNGSFLVSGGEVPVFQRIYQLTHLTRTLPSPPYSGRTPPESGEFGGTQIRRETVLSKYFSHAFQHQIAPEYQRNITVLLPDFHRNLMKTSVQHCTPTGLRRTQSGEFGGTQIGRETAIKIFFPRLWRGQYNTRSYFMSRKKYTEQESNLQHHKTCTLAN